MIALMLTGLLLATVTGLLTLSEPEAIIDYGLTTSLRVFLPKGKSKAPSCNKSKLTCTGRLLEIVLRYEQKDQHFSCGEMRFAEASHRVGVEVGYELRVGCEGEGGKSLHLVLPVQQEDSGKDLGYLWKAKKELGRRVLELTNNFFEVYLYESDGQIVVLAKKPIFTRPSFTKAIKPHPFAVTTPPKQVLKTLMANNDWKRGLPAGLKNAQIKGRKSRPVDEL